MVRLSARNLALVPLVLALVAPACGSDRRRAEPEVSLAAAGVAQAEFRLLRARFFDARGVARASLIGDLSGYLARFPNDPRAEDVRVYLSWAYLEKGDRKASQAALAPVLAGRRGARRDFAEVADAAISTRAGRPEAALAKLEALNGRIIDADERFLYGEERARAAFLSHRYGTALSALLAWLSQSPPDRLVHAQNAAATLIDLVPATDLVGELPGLRRGAGGAASAEFEAARIWLADTVLTRLTRLALERSDTNLARRLLDVAPATLRASADGQLLVALAAEGSKAPAVAGRAVGLLLGLRGPLERRRAAAVSAGMTRALGSAERRAAGHGVELIVRYDTDDVDSALTELFAQGAALLVAGGDDETARLAARRAETVHIPVVLLRPLAAPPASDGFTFVLGTDGAVVEQRLTEELAARGRSNVVRVGPGSIPCDSEAPGPGQPRFPLGAWRKDKVQALLVVGDAGCARDLAGELKSMRESWPIALGIDSSEAFGTLGVPTSTLKAGDFPDKLPAGGWYEALGHDAGILAARALEALPSGGVARGESVRALHEKARDALARAEAELWTSTARGFGGKRELPRELSVATGGPSGS